MQSESKERSANVGAVQWHGGGVFSKVRKCDGKRVFYIQYWHQGRRLTEKVGTSLDRARGRVEARREALEDPTYVPPPAKSAAAPAGRRARFRDFADVFLRDHASKRPSERTWFRPMTERMKREFGPKFLAELKPHDLERYITRRAREVVPATVNHDIRFLKNMFGRAVEWGYLAASPAAKLKQLREDPPRERFLSQDETDRLLAHASPHVRPVVQTALLTGMRRSEILRLTWDRVDLDRRLIYLRKTKSGKPRWVPIGDDLVAILKGIPRHVAHDRVFTYRGQPMDSLKRSWEATRAAAGLDDVRFHDLRHTWASRLVADGVELYELMEQGGWSDITMVRRYAHFSPERKLQTAQRLNGTAGQVVGLVVGQPGRCG